MNDQAQYEELLALGKSLLRMAGENQKLLREILAILRNEDGEPFKLGEPVDPNDLIDD